MVDFFAAVFLGMVQGITEWLPVSSSGHLVLFQQLLGLEAGVAFDIMLHFSTLLVVLAFFRRDVWKIIEAFGRRDFKTGDGRLGLLIILASVCSCAVAFFFMDWIDAMFSSALTVGAGLMVTGLILFSTKFRISKPAGPSWKNSVFIGLAQGVAIVPGISRSGTSVSASLAAGLKVGEAVRFSLLLSIPAITGAVVYALKDAAVLAVDAIPMAAGMITTFAVGWLGLKALVRVVLAEKFWIFAVYCWALGLIVIAFSM